MDNPISTLHLAPSPAPSSASDSDGNGDSRVHFGPFTSPEKKYLAVASQDQTLRLGSPLRRSPRLSSPILQPSLLEPDGLAEQGNGDQSNDEDDEDEVPQSRSGTPENDRWQPDGE